MSGSSFQFKTPAEQVDFPNDTAKQSALDSQWNTNLSGFTRQGICGNPWTATYASEQQWYIDPTVTSIDGAQALAIEWNAFPGRMSFYYPKMSNENMLSLADTGQQTDGSTFPLIPPSGCSLEGKKIPYGPYGPRGWQDEYCEWTVERCPKTNKILRIDLTCENPEYWNSLWMIDPEQVLAIYQATLGKPQIALSDLYMTDDHGEPIVDPSTGRPLYDPLNKWNSGPLSNAERGGAMHLTSTPNTIQTEIGLAAGATTQRVGGNTDPQALICCAQYGQPGRNSDPHIGQSVNQVIAAGNWATLTNPPGLYIQTPDFSSFATPDGAKTPASSFWKVVRGRGSLPSLPGNFALHVTFEVPDGYDYDVGDITIDGKPIEWGGQLARTVRMHIIASALPKAAPPAQPCVGTPASPSPQPLQLFHNAVFSCYDQTKVPNPVGQPMTLLSNSTLIAPIVARGGKYKMVLTADGPGDPKSTTVTFGGVGLTAQVEDVGTTTYAVPGNTYPAGVSTITMTVTVDANAELGLQGLQLAVQGRAAGPPFPACINVVEQIS